MKRLLLAGLLVPLVLLLAGCGGSAAIKPNPTAQARVHAVATDDVRAHSTIIAYKLLVSSLRSRIHVRATRQAIIETRARASATSQAIAQNGAHARATSQAIAGRTLADIQGNRQNLNDILSVGIILGQEPDWADGHQRSFLAPAHFRVRWTVDCALNGDGTHRLAGFYVVGYDGKSQPEQLYMAYNAGAKSGITDIDSSGVKRWAFAVWDAGKQGCSYHLTARKISV